MHALDLFMVQRLQAKLLVRQADLRNGRRPFQSGASRLAVGRRRCFRLMQQEAALATNAASFFSVSPPVNNVGTGLGAVRKINVHPPRA